MKKMFFMLVVLFMMPMLVNAATLVQGISVDGIGDLGLSRNTWTLYLKTTLDYEDIDVIPANDNVIITGAGRVSVEEGDNKIVVTATDGTTKEEYTINIKVARPSKDGSGNPETGAFLSISAVVGGIVVGMIILNLKKSKIQKI